VVKGAEDFDNAFSAMAREQAGALIVQPIFLSMDHGRRLAELALHHRLPAMAGGDAFFDAGGLVSYGPDTGVRLRRAAVIVDRILRGAKPADLPVEQPTHFNLVIKMKTAKTLGVKIPQTILVRAERVIE
jgi:putative ABC transport system substrate-binding protein